MKEKELSDLIQGCRANNKTSQYGLYSLYYNYAMTVAFRYVGNTEEAEEVVNDSFFKVFTKIDMYSGDLSFKSWFRKIIVHTAIDRIRAQKRLPQLDSIDDHFDIGENSSIIDDLNKEQIMRSLNQLSPAYRAVFNLYVVDQFTHEEIADALGISVGTSKSNLARARQQLREILKEYVI